jgi:hypothetical protein
MALYPYARIAHLTGLERAPYMTASAYGHKSTTTPTTISGNSRAVSSYDLCIAFQDASGWWVYPDISSPTTNRHIRTLMAILEHNGYRSTKGTPEQQTKDVARGFDRFHRYYLWVKEG